MSFTTRTPPPVAPRSGRRASVRDRMQMFETAEANRVATLEAQARATAAARAAEVAGNVSGAKGALAAGATDTAKTSIDAGADDSALAARFTEVRGATAELAGKRVAPATPAAPAPMSQSLEALRDVPLKFTMEDLYRGAWEVALKLDADMPRDERVEAAVMIMASRFTAIVDSLRRLADGLQPLCTARQDCAMAAWARAALQHVENLKTSLHDLEEAQGLAAAASVLRANYDAVVECMAAIRASPTAPPTRTEGWAGIETGSSAAGHRLAEMHAAAKGSHEAEVLFQLTELEASRLTVHVSFENMENMGCLEPAVNALASTARIDN